MSQIQTYTNRSLLTVKKFAKKHSAFSESSLRWLIFNEKTNGFSPAFKRVGRRVLVDEAKFFECIDEAGED